MAQSLELRFSPTPSLEHLAWGLTEIVRRGSAVETRVLGLGHEIMNTMTKLMENEIHVTMLE